jgi:geranylgeranyl pyrophosphate synthase
MLIDDLLDEDPRGLQHQIGIGRAANLASALQSLGLTILENTPLSTSLRKAAIHRLNSMLAITAYGQELDTRNPHDEVSYWELVHYKSTPFYAASFALGAVFAEKTARQIDHYHALGVLYGEMIQIHDDLKDSLENPANPDWIQGRNPLPILFAGTVDHPDRAHFLSLRASITEPGHLDEAQDILVRCGAVSYCLDQLLARYEQARDQLKTLDAPTSAWHLFDELVEPMKELLEVGEMPLPPILNLVGRTA